MILNIAIFLVLLTTSLSIHINCGGQAIAGRILADNGFATTPKSIYSNGPKDSVYSSHSWGIGMNTLIYSVPAEESSTHTVRLQFAENWRGNAKKGARVIDVFVNDKKVASNLDVFDLAGGLFQPHDEIVNNVVAPGGKVTVKIVPVVMNAFISGIEITASGSESSIAPTTTPTTAASLSAIPVLSEFPSISSSPVPSESASSAPSAAPSSSAIPSTTPSESALPSPSMNGEATPSAVPSSTVSTSSVPPTAPTSTPEPSASPSSGPRARKLSVAFTRVQDNYPLKVFEAQGTVLGTGNDKYLTVIGGFYKFPGVTAAAYQRPFGETPAPWTRLADMPDLPPVTHMAQWAEGNTFCGAGGFIGRDPGMSGRAVWCLDRSANKWTQLPDLPEDRAGGALAMLPGRRMIYAGGVDRTMNNHNEHVDYGTTWILDLNVPNATWQDTGELMPNPRNHMAAIETCGRYLFVGGQEKINEHSGNMPHIDEWLADEGRWSDNPPKDLPLPLGHISASVLSYKCGVIVVGGITQQRTHSDMVLWWDPVTNEWEQIGTYPNKVATPVCGIHND